MSTLLRKLSKRLLVLTNRCLSTMENSLADRSDRPLSYPPVFILGAPRSGTTLVYQCLVQAYDFGYLSNLHHTFFGGPAVVERVLKISNRPRRAEFSSHEGYVEGLTSPSECWEFWYRFFRRRPQYVPLKDADPKKMAIMRGSIRTLGQAMRRPILIKNLPCALRLEPFQRYLPESLFLVVTRDLLDNASSILAARKRNWGDYAHWWSVEPPNMEELTALPPHEQAVQQMRSIYRTIDSHRAAIGEDRFFDVKYEEFCADTYAVMRQLDEFFGRHGISPEKRGRIPGQFEIRRNQSLDENISKNLHEYIKAAEVL